MQSLKCLHLIDLAFIIIFSIIYYHWF